jgi:hypothetical protein
MNHRTVKLLAIAVGLCFIAAVATNAWADDSNPKPKPKTLQGTIEAITQPVAAAGTSPAVAGSLKVKDKDGNETTYQFADTVTVKIKGEDGKLSDLKEGDKIRFKLDDDGKVASIMHGRKPKTSS